MGARKRKIPAKRAPRRPGGAPSRRAAATGRGSNSRARVGFIGAGNMARSLVGGLLKNRWPTSRIIVADPDPQQRHAIQSILGVTAYADNNDIARRADILVLAVKPQALKPAAQGIAAAVQQKRPLIVTIAAGVRSADLERWLGGNLPVVRAMPNTAALIGSGASGMHANARVDASMRDQAESILRSVGVAVWLDHEHLIDTVTALSGSGPAYFFLVMEALEQAAIEHGLDRATARLLTLETAFGAAKMALEGAEEPYKLRARVTSPGGTTERAIAVLEAGGTAGLFRRAVDAAVDRARELADMFGRNG